MSLAKHLLPIEEEQWPIEFATKQLSILWLPDEINVEKDIQDVLVNFTEAEKHAVINTLKLFSLYETHAGDEYWGDRYKKIFDGAEFHRMASVFSMFELAIHAPFYKKINELLNIDTPEFYMQFENVPVLKQRIESISKYINDPDPLVSLGAFSMVEGAILYSNFAFLKHFQSQGKNKLMSVVRGINFSVKDENLHSLAGAASFKYLAAKQGVNTQDYLDKFKTIADEILEHEKAIIAILFEKGDIKGITAHQLECFVQSRLNECIKELGFKKVYEIKYDPISEWFYNGINNYQFNDFFTSVGSQYHRQWNETDFVWKNQK